MKIGAVVLAALLAAGCYETPKPKCAFLCSASTACPPGYACGGDGRCHLLVDGVPAVCEDALPNDAGTFDAPVDAPVEEPDAEVADAALPDAGIDAGPENTHTGTVSIHDTTILNAPTLGHGLSIGIDFPPNTDRLPDYEAMPGSPVGCKAWLYDLAAGDVPVVGSDEGTITITGTTAEVPDCNFVPGVGYLCIAGAGASDTTVVDDSALGGAIPADTALVTISGATFDMNDVGRYLSVSGATNAANNGSFPVVGVGSMAGQLVIANPAAVTEATAFTGTWTVLAGAGPNPAYLLGAPDPLQDSDMVTAAITPGGGMHIDWDSTIFPFPINTGDSFSLNDASEAIVSATGAAVVLDDGNAVTLNCEETAGSCPAASGTIVTIQSTDAPIPVGAPPYYFPPATSKMGLIRCANIGPSGLITASADAMAFLQDANATRFRTVYLRVGFAIGVTRFAGVNGTNVVVGHSITAFATP